MFDYYLIIIRINTFSIVFFRVVCYSFSWSHVVERLNFPTLSHYKISTVDSVINHIVITHSFISPRDDF